MKFTRRGVMKVLGAGAMGATVRAWFPEFAQATPMKGVPWYAEVPIKQEVMDTRDADRWLGRSRLADGLERFDADGLSLSEMVVVSSLADGRRVLARARFTAETVVECSYDEVLANGTVGRQTAQRWSVDERTQNAVLLGRSYGASPIAHGGVKERLSCGPGYYECYQCQGFNWGCVASNCASCWPSLITGLKSTILCLLTTCPLSLTQCCNRWGWECCPHYQ